MFVADWDTPARPFYQLRIDPRICSGLPSVTPMWKPGFKLLIAHRSLAGSAWVTLLTLALLPPLAAMPLGEHHEVRHEIDHLEEDWRQALLKGDVAAMDSLLADDFMAITASGALQSKDETLSRLRNGAFRIKSIELTDRKVRVYGSTALVTSRAEISGTTPDGDLNGSYRYTRVYARDASGAWRIVSFEASRIRDPNDKK